MHELILILIMVALNTFQWKIVDGEGKYFVNLLASKMQYILIEQLYAKKSKITRENKEKNTMLTAKETVKVVYFC